MFITKKQHAAIFAVQEKEIERLRALLTDQNEVKLLMRRSQDKCYELLEKLTDNSKSFVCFSGANLSGSELHIPDNVPVYVDDHFGGKVIRQEATKVIEIAADGSIKTGLTKQAPDDGFTYILRRECKPTT